MRRLVALYPPDWRSRYGDEMEALLAARPPTIRDRVDIARGALDARLHPQLPGPDRIPDRSGYVVLAGFVALVTAFVLAANGPVQVDDYGTYRDGMAALPFFVLAVGLLSYGLYRVIVRLPRDASGAAAAGAVAIVAGMVWAFMPWTAPLFLAFLLGVLGLAVGARRAGVMPTWSVMVLVAFVALPAGLIAAQLFLPWYAFRVAGLDFMIIFGPLSGLWLLVGSLLLRGWERLEPA